MKLTRKEYTDPAEKKKDFRRGVGCGLSWISYELNGPAVRECDFVHGGGGVFCDGE